MAARSPHPLGWAFFLACSWTWVIGMYLPVLLVRDYGAWGWVVFAAPNVVGAAAMGWVLRDASASRRLVERAGGAVVAFAVVTVVFQAVALGWLGARIGGTWGLVAGVVALVVGAALGMTVGQRRAGSTSPPPGEVAAQPPEGAWRGDRGPGDSAHDEHARGGTAALGQVPPVERGSTVGPHRPAVHGVHGEAPLPKGEGFQDEPPGIWSPEGEEFEGAPPDVRAADERLGAAVFGWWVMAAVAVWVVSMAVFALLIGTGQASFPPAHGALPAWHLLPLASATLLGFLLCPYLDPTFHQARQGTSPAGGRIAFTVGFGVLFLAMIAMSLGYSRAAPMAGPGAAGEGVAIAAARVGILIHLSLQVAFTVGVQLWAIGRFAAAGQLPHLRRAPLLGYGALPLAALLGAGLGMTEVRLGDIRMAEAVYRGFMGFYGLVFPAYVLIVLIARRPGWMWGVAVMAALPFFAAGFLWQAMWWTAAGVGLVVIAALLPVRRVH